MRDRGDSQRIHASQPGGDIAPLRAQPPGSVLPVRRGMASAARAAAGVGGGFADDTDGELHVLKGDMFADSGDEVLGH